MKKASLNVILTLYKRPHLFSEQLLAIESQSVKPEQIILFVNNPEILRLIKPQPLSIKVHTIISSENTFFHGRFAMALCLDTEYTCIFDDDTIPGFRWFESCLNTLAQTGDCILGASGVTLKGLTYFPNHRAGGNGEKNSLPERVDFVGHSWFLRTENLKYLWYEKPLNLRNGEDIALSYSAQKYGNIPTYVPPHPETDVTVHGSLKPYYGFDRSASYLQDSAHFTGERELLIKHYILNGWRTVNNISINEKDIYLCNNDRL